MSKQQIIDPYKPEFKRVSSEKLKEVYTDLFLKYRYLQEKMREASEERMRNLLAKKAYEEYQDTAREIVYYLRSHPDFRTLSTGAKLGVQFLIKIRDIWRYHLETKRDFERIYRMLWLDLLPPADRDEVRKFLEGRTHNWKYQDWEIEIMKDLSLSHIQVAYKIGRSIEGVQWYRYKKLGWRKHRNQEKLQKRIKDKKTRI